jgi:hypothetical protein
MKINMQVFSVILTLLCGIALAAECDGTKLDESRYKMTLHGIKSHDSFVKHMKKHKVSLTSVIEDGNHKMKTPSKWPYKNKAKQALQWEETSDFDDMNTEKWVPQGISSSADAYDKGDWNGKKAWVVSWHEKDDAMVRVTFVDMDTKKYRHVLLVIPTAEDDFSSFKKLHAGGIVWYGDTLWVPDTGVGVRVFDLSNVFKVSTGDKIGKNGDKWTAAGYKYIIPQKGYYKNAVETFHHSFCALDRTDSPDTILFGEYQPKSEVDKGTPTRVGKWELDFEKRALKGSAAKSVYCLGIERMQGAMTVNNKYYISSSNVDAQSNLYTWQPGKNKDKNAHFFPPHSEDISYNKHGNEFYVVTEGKGERFIVTYDLV